MARYTFELRELISVFGKEEVKNWFMNYELTDYVTEEQAKLITDYGVFSKDKLAERIINHFYLREIGTDSPGSFQLFLKDKLNEVMERYVPLLYTTSIKFDPLHNVNIVEEYTRKSSTSGSSNSTTNSNGSGITINSDTPQGKISKSAILNGDYASSTSANESDNSVNDNSTTSGSGAEEYLRKTSGMTGIPAMKLINDYRKNIMTINTDIVYALEPLFMAIY